MADHIREHLSKDPMALKRRHDETVAIFRLLTGADIWEGHNVALRTRIAELEAEVERLTIDDNGKATTIDRLVEENINLKKRAEKAEARQLWHRSLEGD